jgi:hypothetical protein
MKKSSFAFLLAAAPTLLVLGAIPAHAGRMANLLCNNAYDETYVPLPPCQYNLGWFNESRIGENINAVCSNDGMVLLCKSDTCHCSKVHGKALARPQLPSVSSREVSIGAGGSATGNLELSHTTSGEVSGGVDSTKAGGKVELQRSLGIDAEGNFTGSVKYAITDDFRNAQSLPAKCQDITRRGRKYFLKAGLVTCQLNISLRANVCINGYLGLLDHRADLQTGEVGVHVKNYWWREKWEACGK